MATERGLGGLALAGETVWAAEPFGQRVHRVDSTGDVAVEVPFLVSRLAVDDEELWMVSQVDRGAARLNPATLELTGELELGGEPFGIALDPASAWITLPNERQLVRVDRESLEVETVDVGAAVVGVALADSSVWLAGFGSRELVEVDPATLELTRHALDGEPARLAPALDGLWVSLPEEQQVVRWIEGEGTVETIDLTGQPFNIAHGQDGDRSQVWAGLDPAAGDDGFSMAVAQ